MNARRKVLAVLATVVVIGATGLVGGSANASETPTGAVLAPVLLSRNKPTLASSSGGCCPANLAVDGNSATRWASGAGADPQWLRVDLGVTAQISRVRLQWDQSCARNYTIQTSPNGNTWSTISTQTNSDGGVDDLTVTGSGRFVRMHGTTRCRADAAHGYSLQEFDVFGETGGGGDQPPGAPGKPQQVSVTATSATIKWTAAADDHGIQTYQVFRDGQQCATVNGNTLQATCNNLTPNFTYNFYLNAIDTAGQVGPDSQQTAITTPGTGDTQKPTAPGNLRTTGTPTSTSVRLAWNAATDNDRVTKYTIYNNGTEVLGTAAGTATSTTLNGLTPGSTLRLTATATDANNNEGPPSNQITVNLPDDNCNQPVCAATVVGTDNDVVWGLVTLPDGTILFARRDAHNITRLNPATGAKSNVGTVPNAASTNGEGGLMGLEISPTFSSDRWLYIMHTSPSDNRVVRIKLNANNTLDTGSEQVLLTGIRRSTFHNGGRLRWGPRDNKLYIAAGDSQDEDRAQNRNQLNGKILRINPDGTIPGDNPFGNAVWSYGHRNPQGLAFDSAGRLWEQEFGNSVMDETNLIVKGGNYGWPDCEGTSNHGGGGCNQAGFIRPKRTYPVAQGSCSGITIINSALYVACQRGTRLVRLTLNGENVTGAQTFFQGTFGRLRTVEPAPGGDMWMATTNGGDKDSTPNNSNNRIFRVDLR